MEPNYLVLLDFSKGQIFKIRLTEDEKVLARTFNDFESFLPIMEDKYSFKTSHCTWMICEKLEEKVYN